MAKGPSTVADLLLSSDDCFPSINRYKNSYRNFIQWRYTYLYIYAKKHTRVQSEATRLQKKDNVISLFPHKMQTYFEI